MTSLDDLAPYPKTPEEATADNLARHMAVEAHCSATLNTPRFQLMMAAEKTGENHTVLRDLYAMNQALMLAEHGVAFLLHELKRLAPDQADEVAARMWDMWEDPPLQAITWDVLESYGIDPEQVSDAALAQWEAAAKPLAPAPKVAERIAAALEAVDPVEWALAGQAAGRDAAAIARQIGADSA